MRALVGSLIVAALLSLALPAGATHNDHEHSGPIAQVGMARLSWPVPDGESTPLDAPLYFGGLAFRGRLVVAGVSGDHAWVRSPGDAGQGGLATFRFDDRRKRLVQLGTFRCHGLPRVTMWGDLVFQGSVESTGGALGNPQDDCDRDGLRIIDISDPSKPREVGFVPIPCGAVENTVVPSGRKLYVYVPAACQEETDNPIVTGATSEMAVVRVDIANPARSRLVSNVDLTPMQSCEEVAVHLARDLAVCEADQRFILLDISDRANPEVIAGSMEVLTHPTMAPAFSWDGSYLAIGNYDAVRGQGTPSVDVFEIEDASDPRPVGTWSAPPGPGLDQVVRALSFLPTRDGRNLLVVAHSMRGVWVIDLDRPGGPREIAHYLAMDASRTYEPGQEPANNVTAYWHNGRLIAGDWARLRVFRIAGLNKKTVRSFRRPYNPYTVGSNPR